MTIKVGSTVRLVHKGMLEDGTVFDQSTPEQPLEFPSGRGLIMDGFEREVAEMSVGEKKTFTIKDYEAFGEYQEDWKEAISKELVPRVDGLKPGKVIWMLDENGAKVPATVVEIRADEVLFDYNHPLAGKDLTYEVEILEIDESTALSERDLKLEEAKRKHFEGGGAAGEMGMGNGTVML